MVFGALEGCFVVAPERSDQTLSTAVGTPFYVAPEMLGHAYAREAAWAENPPAWGEPLFVNVYVCAYTRIYIYNMICRYLCICIYIYIHVWYIYVDTDVDIAINSFIDVDLAVFSLAVRTSTLWVSLVFDMLGPKVLFCGGVQKSAQKRKGFGCPGAAEAVGGIPTADVLLWALLVWQLGD